MKLPHPPSGGRMLIGMLALIGTGSGAFADPKIPRGTLNVDRSLVRVGTQSQLGWQIQYPGHLDDLRPDKDLKMRVRVLGSTIQTMRTNAGHGNNVDGVDTSNPGGAKIDEDTDVTIDDENTGTVAFAGAQDLPVEVVWSKNGSEWSSIFYGTQSTVVPTSIALNTNVAKDDTIHFGGRVYLNGWLPLYTTVTDSPNVVILRNGDSVPESIPSYQLSLIKGYLKPYLSSDYKTINIGDNEFIIIMELDQSDPNDIGFDLQDMALLVSFE